MKDTVKTLVKSPISFMLGVLLLVLLLLFTISLSNSRADNTDSASQDVEVTITKADSF